MTNEQVDVLEAILADDKKSFGERVEAFKAALLGMQIKERELNNQCPNCASTSLPQCAYTPKVCVECCMCTEHPSMRSDVNQLLTELMAPTVHSGERPPVQGRFF